MSVIIIGGGIGGLALGTALSRAGLPAAIYEREAELQPAGAGLLLQTAPMQALHHLSLDRAALAAGQAVRTASIKDARGRSLQATPLDFLEREFGQPTVALHRARLQSVLLDALGQTRLHLGKRLTGYTAHPESVVAAFDDGSQAASHLLVGADGLRSAVRRQLLGDAPTRYAGYSTYRGLAPDTGLVPAGEVCEIWGRGLRFGYAPIGHGEVYWFAVFNAPAGGRADDPKQFLHELFRHFPAPVPALLAATPAARLLRTDIHDRVPVPRWSAGRVALLGDAAHPTTPNLGQGAGLAIEDAVTLAHALAAAPGDLPRALAVYQAARVPKATRIVEQSWRFGQLGQLESAWGAWLRDRLVATLPASLGRRQLRENAAFSLPA